MFSPRNENVKKTWKGDILTSNNNRFLIYDYSTILEDSEMLGYPKINKMGI